MTNQIIFGIIGEENLAFNKKDLLNSLTNIFKDYVKRYSPSFIIGYSTEFDKLIYKILKKFQKIYPKKNIKIKIVLADNDIIKNPSKHVELYSLFKNDEVIFSVPCGLDDMAIKSSVNKLIISNSCKIFAYLDDTNINYIKNLSYQSFAIINLYNCKEINFNPNPQLAYDKNILEFIDNIVLLDNDIPL